MKRTKPKSKLKIKRNPKFSLTNLHSKYNSEVSYEQIQDALIELYEEVASDLRIKNIKDDRFLDYAGDALSDARVPKDLINKAIKWLEKGAPENIRKNPDSQELKDLKRQYIIAIIEGRYSTADYLKSYIEELGGWNIKSKVYNSTNLDKISGEIFED